MMFVNIIKWTYISIRFSQGNDLNFNKSRCKEFLCNKLQVFLLVSWNSLYCKLIVQYRTLILGSVYKIIEYIDVYTILNYNYYIILYFTHYFGTWLKLKNTKCLNYQKKTTPSWPIFKTKLWKYYADYLRNCLRRFLFSHYNIRYTFEAILELYNPAFYNISSVIITHY